MSPKSIENFCDLPENTKVWRYVSLKKLSDLLEKKALFFARPHTFDDPYEGRITEEQFENLKQHSYFKQRRPLIAKNFIKKYRKQVAVNCWSFGDHECEFMWRLYGQNGVVIQSTIKKLKDSIIVSNENKDLGYLAKVGYIDYETDAPSYVDEEFKKIFMAFHKRKSFEAEHEIRLIIKKKEGELSGRGAYVKIKPQTLIEKILVYPFEDKWMIPAVKAIVEEHKFLNLSKIVYPSETAKGKLII